MSDYFFPKQTAVAVLAPYHLRTSASTGKVLEVDVGDILRKIPTLIREVRRIAVYRDRKYFTFKFQ